MSSNPKEAGNKLFSEKQYEAAIAEYTRAIMGINSSAPEEGRNHKELAVVCGNRAECFIRLGLFEDALKDCYRCLEADPANVKQLIIKYKGHYRKGICLFNLKNYREALSSFNEAGKLDPKNSQVVSKCKETSVIVDRQDSIHNNLLKRAKEPQYAKLPVSLQYTQNKGRAVFSSRDIKEGETILRVKSIATVLDDSLMTTHCCGCFVDITELNENPKDNLCKRCKRTTFCNKCAQIQEHRLVHEEECPIFQEVFEENSKYVIDNSRDQRLLFRLLQLHLREKQGKQIPTNKENAEDFVVDSFADVQTLTYDKTQLHPLQLDAFKECAAISLKMVAKYSNVKIDLSVDDLVNVQCGILQNAHEIIDPLKSSTSGIGIFPTGAYLNHSCRPNCVFYMDNQGFFCFKCIRPVKKGEELCPSYIDILRPTRERHKKLSEQYCFSCECERCIQNEEDPFLEGCMCGEGGCAGLLEEFQKSNDDIQDQIYECSECKRHAKLKPYIELEDKIVAMYEKAHESNPLDEAMIRSALSLADTKLHRFHFMKCIMRRSLIDSEVSREQWPSAVADLTELLAGYSFTFPDDPFIMSLELARRYYHLAKGMKVMQHPKAAQTANLALTIFGVCIGNDHRAIQKPCGQKFGIIVK